MVTTVPTSAVLSSSTASERVSITHASTSSTFKRLLDILGSLVGLTLLAIIFIPIAILIKLDSPGPVLYSQQRHGLLGKTLCDLQVSLHGSQCRHPEGAGHQ